MNASSIQAFAAHLQQVNNSLTQAYNDVNTAIYSINSSELSEQKENLMTAYNLIKRANSLSNELFNSFKVLMPVQIKGELEEQLKRKSFQVFDLSKEAYATIESIKKSLKLISSRKSMSVAEHLASRKLANDGSCCSYEIYDETAISEETYSCTTCWGKDASFRICLFCKLMCHNGHSTIQYTKAQSEQQNLKTICACGKLNHKPKICTRKLTKFDYAVQPYYICHDCFDIKEYTKIHNQSRLLVCIHCMKQCHKGHNTELIHSNLSVCDCGLPGCKISCASQ